MPYDAAPDEVGIDQDALSPTPTDTSDFLLQVLVALINDHPRNGVSVTLSVGGMVISGLAINAKTWMERQAKQLDSVSQAVAVIFTGWSQYMGDAAPAATGHYIERADQFSFIHLDDATVIDGSHIRELGLWRGRLDRVDGWSLTALD